MKHKLFSFVTWITSHPQLVFAILAVLVMLIALATFVAPGGVALAGEINSGS